MNVRQIPEIAPPAPIQEQEEEIEDNRDAEYSAILAGFNVAARVLAARLFLFLSLIGSFVLSLIATTNQSILSVWIVGVFALVTTCPLTILELRTKRGG